jgi:hypothetical protein
VDLPELAVVKPPGSSSRRRNSQWRSAWADGPSRSSRLREGVGGPCGAGLRFRFAVGPLLGLSGVVDLEPLSGGGGDRQQIVGVGADNEVAPAQGSLDDAGIDDVGGAGACR